MIVLDTNVVSETLRTTPDPRVMRWLESRRPGDLYLTATVVAELISGVERLPEGRRRITLSDELELQLAQEYPDRVLPFDIDAARAWGVLVAARARSGRPMPPLDAQIAATCLVHDATLATRNARDFDGCGIHVIDPWGDD